MQNTPTIARFCWKSRFSFQELFLLCVSIFCSEVVFSTSKKELFATLSFGECVGEAVALFLEEKIDFPTKGFPLPSGLWQLLHNNNKISTRNNRFQIKHFKIIKLFASSFLCAKTIQFKSHFQNHEIKNCSFTHRRYIIIVLRFQKNIQRFGKQICRT